MGPGSFLPLAENPCTGYGEQHHDKNKPRTGYQKYHHMTD